MDSVAKYLGKEWLQAYWEQFLFAQPLLPHPTCCLNHALMNGKRATYDPARIRTWNLLIRSQTRYPLRHWATLHVFLWLSSQLWKKTASFRSVVVITCASHAQGRRFEPGRKQRATCFPFFPPVSLDLREADGQGHSADITVCHLSGPCLWLVGLGV